MTRILLVAVGFLTLFFGWPKAMWAAQPFPNTSALGQSAPGQSAPGQSAPGQSAPVSGEEISFEKTQVDDKFRSEGVAVGDFNHDGQMDIAAGDVYFQAPDWTLVPMVSKPSEYKPKGYSNCFSCFADDLNGDGWTDVIVVGFPGKETWWLENPAEKGGLWKRHNCVSVTGNESPQYVDLDGDGQKELLMGVEGGAMAFAKRQPSDPHALWTLYPISTAEQVKQKRAPAIGRFYHGLGLGDVNGDDRSDVIVPDGWWEAPADPKSGPWTFHPANLNPRCAHMYSYDFDGDGDRDVLSSSAHHYGLWWHEQTNKGWKRHEIDRRFSQTHSLEFADINSDGLPDVVTGKRWWAHNGRDPGGNDQPVLYWYEFQPTADGQPQWKSHLVDNHSGVGTQFQVADVNGDNLLDIITSNKRGTFYFRQKR